MTETFDRKKEEQRLEEKYVGKMVKIHSFIRDKDIYGRVDRLAVESWSETLATVIVIINSQRYSYEIEDFEEQITIL